MFKSHKFKANQRVQRNKVYTYGAPVFATDYSTIILAAKMQTNSDEHSMHIRFL
jgi:hypothetical protein